LVKLGKYYPKGIPVKVLFTFDTIFTKNYGAKAMNTVIGLVKKHYQSKSLKKLIGTTIEITGTARKYSKAMTDKGGRMGKGDFPDTFSDDARQQKKYDAYIYLMGVGKNGGGGVSYGATVCNSDKDQRISFVQGPTTSDMTADKLKTTNAAKIKKLASTAAHEIGHTLGMMHDFNDQIYKQQNRRMVYRKYNNKSCAGGCMSYVNQCKKGWSACSARDFSRYLTKGGTTNPCLNYKSTSG